MGENRKEMGSAKHKIETNISNKSASVSYFTLRKLRKQCDHSIACGRKQYCERKVFVMNQGLRNCFN